MVRSASTAASFVTVNISSGMRVWKLESGKTLGAAIKQNEASSESNPSKRHSFLQTKLFGIKRNTMTEKKDGVHKATIKFRKNTIIACTSRKSNSGIKCTLRRLFNSGKKCARWHCKSTKRMRLHQCAAHGAQRSPFRFRAAAFRSKTAAHFN